MLTAGADLGGDRCGEQAQDKVQIGPDDQLVQGLVEVRLPLDGTESEDHAVDIGVVGHHLCADLEGAVGAVGGAHPRRERDAHAHPALRLDHELREGTAGDADVVGVQQVERTRPDEVLGGVPQQIRADRAGVGDRRGGVEDDEQEP
jgi:hypothetical protein